MEYRRIVKLREALSASVSHLSAAHRKQRAEDGLLDVLNAIRQRFWPLDDWARDCLGKALGALSEGRYDDAIANARVVVAPAEERDPTHQVAPSKRTIDDFKVELAKLRTRAVM